MDAGHKYGDFETYEDERVHLDPSFRYELCLLVK